MFLTSCGPSVLDRCMEENEKNFSKSFENMNIELSADDMKVFVQGMEKSKELFMSDGIEDYEYRHLRFIEKVQRAWSRKDFDEIQNLYLSDEYSDVNTYGQLKYEVEDDAEFTINFILEMDNFYDHIKDALEEAETTYEKVNILHKMGGDLSVSDLETLIYLRVYDEKNFEDNRRKYAKNLCHSQGVY
tara:strand:- start:10017 stop:10580 length:564 start_codon:yes stop_codon:yes gene_type:complete